MDFVIPLNDELLDELAKRVALKIAKPAAEVAWLTSAQTAELLGLKVNTLEIWRVKGIGPKFYKLSSHAVRYRQTDVDEWIASNQRTSTSAPVKRRRVA